MESISSEYFENPFFKKTTTTTTTTTTTSISLHNNNNNNNGNNSNSNDDDNIIEKRNNGIESLSSRSSSSSLSLNNNNNNNNFNDEDDDEDEDDHIDSRNSEQEIEYEIIMVGGRKILVPSNTSATTKNNNSNNNHLIRGLYETDDPFSDENDIFYQFTDTSCVDPLFQEIYQSFNLFSDILHSIQTSFDDGDVWREDKESESFLDLHYSEFVENKDRISTYLEKNKKDRNMINLLRQSNIIEYRYQVLKKSLDLEKYRRETKESYTSEKLKELQDMERIQNSKKNNNNSNNNNSSGTSPFKFKRILSKIKNNITQSPAQSSNEFNLNKQDNIETKTAGHEEEEDEEEVEKDYQQDFEIIEADKEIECPICFEENIQPTNVFIISQCSHAYCMDCIREYLNSNILSKNVNIPCPTPKCTSFFQYDQIKYIVDPLVFAKYEEFTFNIFLMKSPNYKWCPNPNCGNVVYGEVDNPRCKCSNINCNFDFCFNCEVEWHHNSTCHQYQIWRIENKLVDTTYSVWTKKADTKKCPKCKSIIEKNEGCNHIMCHCGYNFCWLCGGKFTSHHYDPFNPFGCPGLGVSNKLGTGKRMTIKVLVGLGVVIGCPIVVSVGIPVIIIAMPIYAGYLAHKQIKRTIVNKKKNEKVD